MSVILTINELSLSMMETLNANHLSGIEVGPSCPPIHSLVACGKAYYNNANMISQIINRLGII